MPLSSLFQILNPDSFVSCSGLNKLINLGQQFDKMSTIKKAVPIPRYNSQFSNTLSNGPAPDAQESFLSYLKNYLKNLLPKNVDPMHVLIGFGIAFAGVTGGVLLINHLRKASQKELVAPEDPEDVTTPVIKSYIDYEDDALNNNNAGGSEANNNAVESETELKYSESRIPPQGSPQGVLILNPCPRGRKTPCIAPYPLKLETYLRVAGIKYEFQDSTPSIFQSDPKALVTLDMEKLTDSQISMKYLNVQFGVNLSKNISLVEKALEKAFNHLLEQKIYWGISLYRWVYDGARSIEKIQYLPDSTRDSIPSVARTVEHAAWHHGIGKRNPTEVVADVTRDLAALSVQLGTKQFFLSDEYVTELDCTAFAMLSQMLWTMDGPFHAAISETYTNLADFCWRMRTKYWPDWDDCLQSTPPLYHSTNQQ